MNKTVLTLIRSAAVRGTPAAAHPNNSRAAAGSSTTASLHSQPYISLLVILLSFAMVSSIVTRAGETNLTAQSVKLPAKRKIHLYLLMGQSNMAGRGAIEAEDRTPNPRVLTFTTNGTWEIAVEPVTHDKPKALGVGPGLAFGKAMAETHPGVTIGLVPCAVGGTPLSRWERGNDLYSNATARAKLAMKSGTLKGILWHQGESDSKPGLAETYGDRLAQMIQDIRADLNSPALPFVAGQLGEFLFTRQATNITEARLVNDTLAGIPGRVPHTGCALSNGLTHKGDQVHFDASSQRKLGQRYAAEMIRLQADLKDR